MTDFNGDPGLIVELVSDVRYYIDQMVQKAFDMPESERKAVHGYLHKAREELSQWHDVRTVRIVREDHE